MKRLRALVLGPVIIALVAGGMYLGIKAAYGGFGHYYYVTAALPRAGQELEVGSDVRMRGVVVGRVKPVKRRQVAKRQRQLAALRANSRLQQTLERPGAAQLVAVHQRADHHSGAAAPGVKVPDALHPGVAGAPGGDVRPPQFKRQKPAHSVILA